MSEETLNAGTEEVNPAVAYQQGRVSTPDHLDLLRPLLGTSHHQLAGVIGVVWWQPLRAQPRGHRPLATHDPRCFGGIATDCCNRRGGHKGPER